jgi:predicted amidophosphoribosyltransferase
MAGEFKQCKMCGQIYRYIGNQFCGNCLREMDEQFRVIKDLLYKNPNLTINEVVEETGVDEKIILFLLREGRLEMKAAGDYLVCEGCGVPIQSGKLCKKCSTSLSSALEKASAKSSERSERSDRSDRSGRLEGSKQDVNNKGKMRTYVEKKHY